MLLISHQSKILSFNKYNLIVNLDYITKNMTITA